MTSSGELETRRERKRRSTHEALLRAALDLFEERGYAATTIEDITERADVARRTFFRHFTSKEAVLFPDPEEYELRLVAALDAQSPPLTMSSVLDAFVAAATASEDDDLHRRRRAAIVATEELQLSGAVWQAFVTTRATIVGQLAARSGLPPEDQRVEMAASLGLFVISHAYVRWTEGDPGRSLADELHDTIATMRSLLEDEVVFEPG